MTQAGDTQLRQRLAAILAADAAGYTRLMAADERATLSALDDARGVFREHSEANQGRVIDTAGDSVLALFETAVGAVSAARAIQSDLDAAGSALPEERRMRFRIGLHLGDVIEKADGTAYGDGVNIAARLQALAEPGGIAVSESIRSAVRGRSAVGFEDLGEQRVKNVAEPVRAFRLGDARPVAQPRPVQDVTEQEIRFCTALDGVQLAYASIGSGPVLVKTGTWMTHLEYELQARTVRTPWMALASEHTLVRYDPRGNGLSDRDVREISFDAFVSDLETVVDAAGLERFALLGISQGCSVSVAYAARHPERVSHLVLYGGFAQGFNRRPHSESEQEAFAAMLTLVRLGWGQDNPAFRQMFTSQFMPDATREQVDWFNELQRRAASPENAVRYLKAVVEIDVTHLLGQVRVPTLVLHVRDDARVAFDLGRRMAAAIPGARLVPLPGRNHIVLEGDPGYARFLQEVSAFLRT